jgi:predicted DNA-binding protein (MmcQ/YjbR family)
MTADEFRALALSFPQAVEGSHFDTADFRVGKKIFATLRESDGRAVLSFRPTSSSFSRKPGAAFSCRSKARGA